MVSIPATKQLYSYAPKYVQNAALSLYGRRTYAQRFGGPIPSLYKEQYALDRTPDADLFEDQEKRLKYFLERCKSNVPYCGKILRDIDIEKVKPNDIKNLFPVLTKDDIKYAPDFYTSKESKVHKGLSLHTSGTSGKPLTIKCSFESRRINYAQYDAVLNAFGCHYRTRSTTFAGRILYRSLKSGPDRYDQYNKTQYLSSYFISEDTVESYIKSLNSWKPAFIDSYPSALLSIVKLSEKKRIDINFTPNFIITSSETLSGKDRKLISQFFHCPVIDHYGCTEMCISAFSLSNSKPYFVDPRYSIVELSPMGDNIYELLVTGLVNTYMPLIRYKVGDLVQVTDDDNPYSWDNVIGRSDDTIITPEGYMVGRLDPVFKGIYGIDSSQIIQEKRDQVTLKIVLDKKHREDFDEKKLIANFKERTSSSISVSIEIVDSIPLTTNGKFKTVVRRCD